MYFSSAGEKIFDVEIGGEQILKDIDIFGKVGKATALDEYIPIEIKNDKLLFNGNNKYSTKDSKFLLDKINWTLDQETFLYNYINTINDIKDAATIRKRATRYYTTKRTKEDDVYKCSRAYFKSSFI